MITRDQMHIQIVAMLKDQDYGFRGAQPSRAGMAWAIVNTVWPDVAEIAMLRSELDRHRRMIEQFESLEDCCFAYPDSKGGREVVPMDAVEAILNNGGQDNEAG